MSSGTGLPALDNTMGALFLGVIFAMGLWGAGTVQMYYYYDTYGKDELWIKMVVFSVWIFDTVHQGLITHSCYIYLITEYGNPLFLATLEKTLMIMVFFTACICFIVQTFFTMRIWRLSHKSVYLTGAVYIFVLTQLVSTLVYFGTAIHFKLFAELLAIKNLTRSINVVNAIADAVGIQVGGAARPRASAHWLRARAARSRAHRLGSASPRLTGPRLAGPRSRFTRAPLAHHPRSLSEPPRFTVPR
ncbi:hypothetical protein DFH11DRAFT_1731396 [Phellopilus nigrolimitatus]|nr:hypothetical protein DFH11DRAFT_1731396 [Phellopilus nigrolimitatus]